MTCHSFVHYLRLKVSFQRHFGVYCGLSLSKHHLKQTEIIVICHGSSSYCTKYSTVEFQWLEHLWNYENMFETGVV